MSLLEKSMSEAEPTRSQLHSLYHCWCLTRPNPMNSSIRYASNSCVTDSLSNIPPAPTLPSVKQVERKVDFDINIIDVVEFADFIHKWLVLTDIALPNLFFAMP